MRFNYHDDGWLPSDETVREQARLMENLPYPINLDEAAVPEYRIPEILEDGRGGTITTVGQWRSRREQLLHLFRKNMYGFSPAPFPGQWHEGVQVDEKAMGGTLR